MTSAPHEKYLAITVKEERYVSGNTKYPPLLSPLLVKRTVRGMRLHHRLHRPLHAARRHRAQTDHLVHVAPARAACPTSPSSSTRSVHPKLKHTFLYSNKTWDDIIFRDELDRHRAAAHRQGADHPRLTREEPPDAPPGPGAAASTPSCSASDPRPERRASSTPAVRRFGPDRQAAREKGVEPTPRFLEAVSAAVKEIGIPKDRYKTEVYG